jgi:hypothetical protein
MSDAATPRYQLQNGEELNLSHPDTFHIPDRAVREDLEAGIYAKVIFVVDMEYAKSTGTPPPFGMTEIPTTERMWIKVVSKAEDGIYTGTLASTPEFVDLKFGDEIQFRPEHIINTFLEYEKVGKPRYQRLVKKPSEAKKDKQETKIPENGLYIWLRSPRQELPSQQQPQNPA